MARHLSCVFVLIWQLEVFHTCLASLFDDNISAIYDSDVTNTHGGFNNSKFVSSIVAALAIKQDGEKTIFYVAEQYDIHKQTKIGLTTSSSDAQIRFIGANISAADPRLLQVGLDMLQIGKIDETFVIFHALCPHNHRHHCIMFTPFGVFQPQIVSFGGNFSAFNSHEKNWAPFAKDGHIMFVYSYDPLVVIDCPNVTCGSCCRIAYVEKGVQLPLVTMKNSILRGGSNLLPLLPNRKRYYIGGCHAQLSLPITHSVDHKKDSDHIRHRNHHLTHFVVVDTLKWQLVYVSKPIRFPCPNQIRLGCIENRTLLDVSHHLIQEPISLMPGKQYAYRLTINVRNTISLLYDIEVNPYTLIKHINDTASYTRYGKGHWENMTWNMNVKLLNTLFSDERKAFPLSFRGDTR